MVAFVGLTHMVPSTIDKEKHRIMVFEGSEDIRADLLSWLQTRQSSSVPMRRTTRASTRDADKGDGTNSEPSNTSDDTPVSPPLRNEVASNLDPSAGAVEGNTMDRTVDAAILGVNPPMGVQASNVVFKGTAEEVSIEPTV
jgi:hypothetical protein